MFFKLLEWRDPDDIIKEKSEFEKKLKQLGIKRNANYKAKIKAGGNTKLGKDMGTFSKLYGDDEYDTSKYFDKDYIDTKDINNKDAYLTLATMKGSCREHCKGCKNDCYVKKSYDRWTNRDSGVNRVIQNHTRNQVALQDLEQAFYDLNGQLERMRRKFPVIRIHQSGELESEDEFRMWCSLADRHPESIFYIYTKAFEFIEKPLDEGFVPDNFHICFSVWKHIGIDEYNKYKDYPNVKAFACIPVDNKAHKILYDYFKEEGLKITSMCPAYNIQGRLVHPLDASGNKIAEKDDYTKCVNCKKCFVQEIGGPVIGCYSH